MNIADKLKGLDIWLVGGAVRDKLLGCETSDWDFVMSGAKDFASQLDGRFIVLDEKNKIYRVVSGGETFDFTELSGSIEDDLARRDLTINAIAQNMKTGEIVDLFGGAADIKNKIIRHIADENFDDDPLRLLRVYRFQATTGFKIAPATQAAVAKRVQLIHNSAQERINYELLKLFGGAAAHTALLDMGALLEEIFPFVKELKQIPPNTHHHLDLFHHCVEVVHQIGLRSDEYLERVDFGGGSRLAHLKFAGLLHDIGKFSTRTVENGRDRFIKHDDAGGKIAAELLTRMKFSKKQVKYLSGLVKNHLYPSQLVSDANLSDKTMMRFIRKMGDDSIDVIVLAQSDRLSARGEAVSDAMVEKNLTALDALKKFYFEKSVQAPLPKLLSGQEVMEITGLKPSKRLGLVMNALYEAQVAGDVNNKEEACEFIRNVNI